jgi:carboxypeptidase Ss1
MSCQEVLSAARAMQDRIVAWRRDFHKHPELGFQETRTSGIVAEELERLGLKVRRHCPKTAVSADLVVPGAKDFFLLRADMDALPVQENSGEPFASVYAGKAHLCGHDSHVAMLLGAANVLTQMRHRLRTNVRFMFQPSEEATPGGAEAMIAEGVLDGVTEAFAIHVFTAQQAGRWGLVPGPVMAATDAIRFVIKGRGGHAATPEMCVDPIVAAAQLIMNLQTVMSRRVAPLDCGVLSLCKIAGGAVFNVIPETVEILGTLRTHSEKTRERVKQMVGDIVHGLELSTGVTVATSWDAGYPTTVNNPAVIERVRAAVADLFGPQSLEEIPKKFGGEDFSFLLQKVPGAMVFLGVANTAKGIGAAHHNPEFRIDEDVLWQGTALLAEMATRKTDKG